MSKKQTHTPGPWEYIEAVVCNSPGIHVVRIKKWGGINIAKVDNEADARLIAAAPEMLGALKRVLETTPHWNGPQGDFIRDAIAKAEGRDK